MTDGSRTVSLTIPATGEYVVLARLALSALCRLTPLRPDDVADLKLAITEAATGLIGLDPEARVSFEYRLDDTRISLDITGPGNPQVEEDELELGRAIVAATVDEHELSERRARLVKYLRAVE